MASIDDYNADVDNPDTTLQELNSILDGIPTRITHICDHNRIDAISLKTMENVYYAVSAICFDKNTNVLLVQQAMPHVYQRWYLPSGRLNQGETIEEACKRITKQQTGLTVKPEAVVLVETGAARWFRFIFKCEITGGNLKGKKQDNIKDNEPLQSEFVPIKTYMKDKELSSGDIVHQISLAKNWTCNDRRLEYRPGSIPYTQITIRLICTTELRNQLVDYIEPHILLMSNNTLPTYEIPDDLSFEETIIKNINKLLKYNDKTVIVSIDGIIAIDHTGIDGKDGCCFTILIKIKPFKEIDKLTDAKWVSINGQEMKKLRDKIMCAFKYMKIPIQ